MADLHGGAQGGKSYYERHYAAAHALLIGGQGEAGTGRAKINGIFPSAQEGKALVVWEFDGGVRHTAIDEIAPSTEEQTA